MKYRGVISMKNNKTIIGVILNIIGLGLMAIVTFLVLYPLFFILMTSFKENIDVIANPFTITTFRPLNYIDAWKIGRVQRYFWNSVIVTAVTIIGQLVFISISAYSLGRLRPKGTNILMMIFLSTLFITGEMTTIPVFMMIRRMGLLNTRMGLILPYTLGGLGMGIFIASNYVKSIPKELDEAATVDGSGILRTFISIYLPLMRPILSLVAIMAFQGVWSEFFWALIVITRESIKTLPLGLINFQSQYNSNYGVLSAGLTILTLPILLVYIFFSKYFIEGVAAGAIKG
jgi:raffinose/stachyose/melibiose transport system permease protein